jgi:hypothetical protein
LFNNKKFIVSDGGLRIVDLGNILTIGVIATAMPFLLGLLLAYSIIATILGAALWPAKSVPDDICFSIIGSGLVIGGLMLIGVTFVNLVLS